MLKLIVEKGQKLKCVNHVEFMGKIIVETGEICAVSLVYGDSLKIQTRYGEMAGTLSEIAEHFTLMHNSDEKPKKEECGNANTCSKEWDDDDEFWNEEYDDEEDEEEYEHLDHDGTPIFEGDRAVVVVDSGSDGSCIHFLKKGTMVRVLGVSQHNDKNIEVVSIDGKIQYLHPSNIQKIQDDERTLENKPNAIKAVDCIGNPLVIGDVVMVVKSKKSKDGEYYFRRGYIFTVVKFLDDTSYVLVETNDGYRHVIHTDYICKIVDNEGNFS